MSFDESTIQDLFSFPGADTRGWIEYGIVESSSEGGPSVRFNDDDGQPLENGVLVDVTLQPSGITVPCRILSATAGSGEGEFSPFGPGDEVLVGVPDGDERNGCVILGRMSNGKDIFPQAVAGMDVTNNSVTFRRLKTPYIMETAASYMVRQASTGASFSIDPTGNITFGDGAANLLALSHSVISLQEATGSTLLQIDPGAQTLSLQASSSAGSATTLVLDDANGSVFMTGQTLSLITAGGGYALGHAITMEQVVCMFKAFCIAVGTANPAVLTGAALAALATTGVLFPGMVAKLDASVLVPPLDTAAVLLALQHTPDAAGISPGFGRAGLMY
jgi:hypothetical protein